MNNQATYVKTLTRAVTIVAGLLLASSPAGAQQELSLKELSLQEAYRLASTDEPGQLSLRYQAEALQEEAQGAEVLPDPMLRLGMVNLPTDSFDFDQEPMTQLLVGIKQSFPKGNMLQYRADLLNARANGVLQRAVDRQRQVGLLAQKAWLEIYYWEQAEAIVNKNRNLFEQLVKVSESLFSVGRKTESDLVRAQLELGRLDLRLVSIRDKIRQNRALLGQWLGDGAVDQSLAPLAEVAALPELFELQQKLESHPKLTASAARIKVGEYAEKLAREQFKPGFGLDISYGLRGNDRSDLASLMVTLDYPLFSSKKQDANQRAAIRATESERARRVEIYRQLKRELQVQYSRSQELDKQKQLFDREILPQARQQSKAALAAYQSDRGDFPELMRAYISELNTELNYRRLIVDRSLARVATENLIGEPL